MTLINQPSRNPTRKLWAVIISGGILGAINAALTVAFPGTEFMYILDQLTPYLIGILMAIAGYFTRDAETVRRDDLIEEKIDEAIEEYASFK